MVHDVSSRAPSGCAALVLGWVALGLAAWALPQLVQVAWAGERAR